MTMVWVVMVAGMMLVAAAGAGAEDAPGGMRMNVAGCGHGVW